MTGDCHVRFGERLEGKFLWPTHLDITINRKLLGLQISDQDLKQLSRKKRDQILEDLKEKGHKFIEKTIIPVLQTKFSEYFPKEGIEIKFSEDDPLSLEVFYPTRMNSLYNSYIKPRIYIEFGVRGDVYPTEEKIISPYLHENIKQLETVSVPVKVLHPMRTFFEKVTLLHAEAHRTDREKTPLRLSRHLYDLHQLKEKGYLAESEKQMGLLTNVIEHKSLFFASKKASYEAIYTEGLKLLPSEEGLNDIERDYNEMQTMFFGESPAYDSIIISIKDIEIILNKQMRQELPLKNH